MQKIAGKYKTFLPILSSVIAFLCLNNHSLLSHDEMGTLFESRMPFGKMLRFLFAGDVHPPVYFVLLKSWQSVFGQSVFAARCFSFAAMIACAVFAGGKVRRLFGEKTAFWFVAFLLFSPLSLWLGRFIRMYSWTLFFTTMAFLSAETALRKNDKREYALFVVFAVLASWTHYYAALTCGVMTLMYLCRAYDSAKAGGFKRFFICGIVLFFCVSPTAYVLSRQNLAASRWITGEAFASYNLFFENDNFFSAFLVFSAWAFGIQALLESENTDEKAGVLTGLYVAVFVLCVGFTLSVLWRPVIVERYLTATLGGVFLFFAFGAAKKRANELFFAVFLTLSFLGCFAAERQKVAGSVQPEFYNAVKANVAKDDTVIANGWWMPPWLSYHFPDYTVFGPDDCSVCIFNDKIAKTDKAAVVEMLKTKRVFTTDANLYTDCEQREIMTAADPYVGAANVRILRKRSELMSLSEIVKCE